LVLIVGLVSRLASAQTPAPAPATPAGPVGKSSDEATSSDQRSGFSILVTAGYGRSTQRVYRVHLDPYAASFGLEPGYTFHNGLRLGAYAQLGLGREIAQEYDPVLGDNYDLSADSMSVNAGASLAYDLPLYMFVLRYSLNLGFTRMTWDFSDTLRVPLGFDAYQGTQYGFSVSPGLSLLWTVSAFQCGLGFEYLIQSQDRIPSGPVAKLLLGVKL
jgi:hypothetical protein